MSVLGGTLGKVAAAFVVGTVLTSAGLGAAFATGTLTLDPPTVESIQNEWGEVTDETTGIETRLVVTNPNGVAIPGVAGVEYDVNMNDVTVASGSSGGIGLSPGENEVTLRTDIDNGKIPAWWATHINNGEETTISIRPSLDAPLFSSELPAQDRTFSTDLLSSFESDSGESVTAGGRTLLTVESTDASWGEATAEETPLQFSGTVTNPNDEPLEFAEIGYTVSMNDVTLAEGTTGDRVEIGANETETIRIDSALDNQRLDEWWVSHLNRGEKTDLEVEAFAEVETDDGTQRVPLSFLSKRVVFETDILGGGAATTRAADGDGSEFESPTIESVERDWASTDSGTRFATTVVVNNPNPANATPGELALDATYRVALNDVGLVNDSQRATLTEGRNELGFESDVSDRTITEWWVSHIERGERTDLTTEADVSADLGFTSVPVEVPDQSRSFETDVLSGFDDSEQEVSVQGQHLATMDDMTSEWGDPTMNKTPMVVSGEVTNERTFPLTIERFGYEVRMNDVVLADNESHVGTTVPGQSTRDIETTGYLENDRIPEWWVSHLDNDERSELSVSYYAVVSFGGQEYTVELDSMSYEDVIETNAFGDE
ncbi:LEA type 2 family protein [Halorussus amylolyticus]|uniref:LEA type 2 family protein n=1 Tax=Halorussus amylolyticus TaxID=1126242 RepID=UPI00104BE6BE|nr:LEA type 2 family protein [Halorussus amylolyticus]